MTTIRVGSRGKVRFPLSRRRLVVAYTPVLAFMLFDHAITLGQEIDLFWRRGWTGASAIFLLNRYLAVVNFVLAMCEYAPKTELVRLNGRLLNHGHC